MGTLTTEVIRTAGLILEHLGLRFDEKAGSYFYDTILVKRCLEGASASGTCELCEENVDEGWIDSEDVYPSGDDGPPFHPHCVCSEQYSERRVRVYV